MREQKIRRLEKKLAKKRAKQLWQECLAAAECQLLTDGIDFCETELNWVAHNMYCREQENY